MRASRSGTGRGSGCVFVAISLKSIWSCPCFMVQGFVFANHGCYVWLLLAVVARVGLLSGYAFRLATSLFQVDDPP